MTCTIHSGHHNFFHILRWYTNIVFMECLASVNCLSTTNEGHEASDTNTILWCSHIPKTKTKKFWSFSPILYNFPKEKVTMDLQTLISSGKVFYLVRVLLVTLTIYTLFFLLIIPYHSISSTVHQILLQTKLL